MFDNYLVEKKSNTNEGGEITRRVWCHRELVQKEEVVNCIIIIFLSLFNSQDVTIFSTG